MNIEKQSRAYSIPNVIDLPTIEQPIATELLIPEYCPDIIKILKCDVKNRVLAKRLKEHVLELELCAEITILYCGEDNVISSVITKYNYSKTIENKSFINNSFNISVTNNNFNCRQTAARRVDVKGSVNINISINSFEAKEILFNIDREDVEQLKCNYETTSTIFTGEKRIIVEDELLLSSDKPDINYILRQNAMAIINECKQIGEKAVIKGNIKVDVLYCSVSNSPANFSETIPFSQIIELNVKEKTCNVTSKASIMSFDIKPIMSTNSNAGFLVNVCLNISLIGKCNIPVTIIKDCYSTKISTDITQDKIHLNKLVETINERIVIKKTVSLNDNHISSVADLWCKEVSVDGIIENGDLKLSGLIECSMLFCNVDNVPEHKDFKLDYEFSKKINDNSNLFVSNLEQRITSCSYTLISNNQVEIQAEACVCAEIYEKHVCECVCDVVENESVKDCDDSIIIYYCENDESVWNIAKRFLTPLNTLKEQNNLTDEFVSSNSVLVITRMWGDIYE